MSFEFGSSSCSIEELALNAGKDFAYYAERIVSESEFERKLRSIDINTAEEAGDWIAKATGSSVTARQQMVELFGEERALALCNLRVEVSMRMIVKAASYGARRSR